MTKQWIFAALVFVQGVAFAAASDWVVVGRLQDPDLEKVKAGEVAVVPIEAVLKEGAERRTFEDYLWKFSQPDRSAGVQQAFDWGSKPFHKHGQLYSWWWHERLAFNFSTKEVNVIPRRGMGGVISEPGSANAFWCQVGLQGDSPVVKDRPVRSSRVEMVCPTSFLRSLGTKRGIPGISRQELYAVDTDKLSSLIGQLGLEARAVAIRDAIIKQQLKVASETEARRDLDKLNKDLQKNELVAREVRSRDAYQRGQAIISNNGIGELLCRTVNQDGRFVTISAFLEEVKSAKVKLRVNSMGSDNFSWNGTLKDEEGVAYSPGAVLWSRSARWQACN